MSTTVFEHQATRGRPPRVRPPAGRRFLQDRRRFLATSLAAVGAYAVTHKGTTWIVGAGRAWAAEMQVLEPDVAEALLHMTRALYPHDPLGDVHYAKVVQDLDAEAAGFDDKERLDLLRDGVLELNEAAGGTFTSADEAQRQDALKKIEDTTFFQAVRGKAVVSLYNQPEVWKVFGYEGPSFERGGYLFNGFNDLDWLPEAPAEASPPVQI